MPRVIRIEVVKWFVIASVIGRPEQWPRRGMTGRSADRDGQSAVSSMTGRDRWRQTTLPYTFYTAVDQSTRSDRFMNRIIVYMTISSYRFFAV